MSIVSLLKSRWSSSRSICASARNKAAADALKHASLILRDDMLDMVIDG